MRKGLWEEDVGPSWSVVPAAGLDGWDSRCREEMVPRLLGQADGFAVSSKPSSLTQHSLVYECFPQGGLHKSLLIHLLHLGLRSGVWSPSNGVPWGGWTRA